LALRSASRGGYSTGAPASGSALRGQALDPGPQLGARRRATGARWAGFSAAFSACGGPEGPGGA